MIGGVRGGDTRSRFTSLSGDASALQPPTTYSVLPTMVAPCANRPAGDRHLQGQMEHRPERNNPILRPAAALGHISRTSRPESVAIFALVMHDAAPTFQERGHCSNAVRGIAECVRPEPKARLGRSSVQAAWWGPSRRPESGPTCSSQASPGYKVLQICLFNVQEMQVQEALQRETLTVVESRGSQQ